MLVFETYTSKIEGLTRLDPEYYNPAYLQVVEKVRKLSPKKVADVFNIQLGPAYFSKKIDVKTGIKIAKIGEVTNKRKIHEWVYLDEVEFRKYGSRQILNDEILLTLTGDPPDVGKTFMPLPFCSENDQPIAFNQRVAKLKSKEVDPHYLYAFLSTEYFRIRFEQVALGIRQRNVSIPDLLNAYVFIPDDKSIISEVGNLIRRHFELAESSEFMYAQANHLLEQSLGLDKLQLEQPKSYLARFSDVLSSRRLDSEYFQPKFEQLYAKLIDVSDRNKWTFMKLGTIASSFKYGSSTKLNYIKSGVPFLRIADLINNRFEKSNLKFISYREAEKEKSSMVFSGDMLISRSGTLGLTVPINKELDESIFGSYFIKFRPNSACMPKYLAFYLNSIVGRMQVEQINSGGIQTNLTIPMIQSLRIIIPDFDFQKQITNKIDDSENMRIESESLLLKAKLRVGQLIEEAAVKQN